MRLSFEEQASIKNKLEVDTLYSFSRIDCFHTCPYSYYLKYVLKKPRESNIYALLGTASHDIVQDLSMGKIEYSDMLKKFETQWSLAKISGYKFSSDVEKNASMSSRYLANMKHFFTHHKPHPFDSAIELPVYGKFGEHAILGYIDETYVDSNNIAYVIDYKTSTKYSGKELIKKSKQLLTYAKCLHDMTGHPYKNMKIGFNFMKYVNISYLQKNGKIKTTYAERRCWVSKISKQLQKLLDAENLPKFQAELMLTEAINNNSLENMPEHIQDFFTVDDCWVLIDLSEDQIKELEDKTAESIEEIESYIKKDSEDAWSRGIVTRNEEYFCTVICDVKKHCKYLKDYNDNKNMFLTR